MCWSLNCLISKTPIKLPEAPAFIRGSGSSRRTRIRQLLFPGLVVVCPGNFHCRLSPELPLVFQKLPRLSPEVAAFTLASFRRCA